MDYSSLILPVVNFGTYAVVAVYLYGKHATPALRARSHRISEHVREAGANLSAAEMQLKNSKSRLRGLEPEKAAILEGYHSEGQRMAAVILDSARGQAERLLKDTERQLGLELKKTEQELKARVVRMAAEGARAKLSSELDDARDGRLRERMLADLVK